MGIVQSVDSIAHLKAHDVCIVAHELRNQILLPVAPRQHPGLTVAELLRLHPNPPESVHASIYVESKVLLPVAQSL